MASRLKTTRVEFSDERFLLEKYAFPIRRSEPN
jgi:hypothetical protein